MRALVINEPARKQIAEMLKRARANVNSMDMVMQQALMVDQVDRGKIDLKDRKPGSQPLASFMVWIERGFRCNISFEQQPFGLCRHLSVSVDEGKDGKIPSPEHVKMLCEEFGFKSFPPEHGHIWLEEFTPGCRAVNIVELIVEEEQ